VTGFLIAEFLLSFFSLTPARARETKKIKMAGSTRWHEPERVLPLDLPAVTGRHRSWQYGYLDAMASRVLTTQALWTRVTL
jgi:hypothetical protein